MALDDIGLRKHSYDSGGLATPTMSAWTVRMQGKRGNV